MKLFSLATLTLGVGCLAASVWTQSLALAVAGALVLVIGVLAATVVDLIANGEDE